MDFPPGARFQSDGRVTFPMRGQPPACNVPGYVEDPDDPFQWIKLYEPCKHRAEGVGIKCPASGKVRQGDYCKLLLLKINPLICSGCLRIEVVPDLIDNHCDDVASE